MRATISQHRLMLAPIIIVAWAIAGVMVRPGLMDAFQRKRQQTKIRSSSMESQPTPSSSYVPPSRPYDPNTPPLISREDAIFIGGNRNSPIVIEEYKLLFFPVAKVGSSVWKFLFRRMMGYEDWQYSDRRMPHDPEINGLTYLFEKDVRQANYMMTSPEWTRVIIVRDPKERMLSAFLDKKHDDGMYYRFSCCSAIEHNLTQEEEDACVEKGLTFDRFVNEMMVECDNVHWRPIYEFIDEKFWPFINFVGHIETVEEDAKKLLKSLGVWEKYGSNGWGEYQNQSMFHSSDGRHHATDAKDRMKEYFTPELEEKIEAFYEKDYAYENLNFTLEKISG